MKSDVEEGDTILTSEHFRPGHDDDDDNDLSFEKLKENGYGEKHNDKEEKRSLLDQCGVVMGEGKTWEREAGDCFKGFIGVQGFGGNGIVMVNTTTGQVILKVFWLRQELKKSQCLSVRLSVRS